MHNTFSAPPKQGNQPNNLFLLGFFGSLFGFNFVCVFFLFLFYSFYLDTFQYSTSHCICQLLKCACQLTCIIHCPCLSMNSKHFFYQVCTTVSCCLQAEWPICKFSAICTMFLQYLQFVPYFCRLMPSICCPIHWDCLAKKKTHSADCSCRLYVCVCVCVFFLFF